MPSYELEVLRQFIAPPGDLSAYPTDFGPAANAIMLANGITWHDLWTVVQARVWSTSVAEFGHALRSAFGDVWTADLCEQLWSAMHMPRSQ